MPRNDVRRRVTDLNGRMTDSSKTWLEENVRKAFGYGYRVDPFTHRGPMVNKYRWHAHHPTVMIGPLPSTTHINPDYRFFSELLIGTEWRIAIFGKERCLCTYTQRQIDSRDLGAPKRIDGSSRYAVTLKDVASRFEWSKLLNLASMIGLDYGEFDVIRHADGRFCPIDVNPSPSPPSPHSFTAEDFARIIPTEAALFQSELL